MTDADLPAWATEAVHLADHDPAWAGWAQRYAAEVRALFAGRLVTDVVHVGSTSIPDLRAKPVIDLQAVSPDPAAALADVGDAAGARGWMLVPRELDRNPWRWLLVRVDDAARTRLAHLHLMPPGQDRWSAQLRFRDRLRESPSLRGRYAAVKERAAVEHADDREAYTRAKRDVVLGILAEEW